MSQAAKMTPQDELEELLGFKAEPEPEPEPEDAAPAAVVEDDEPEAREPEGEPEAKRDEPAEDATSEEAPPIAAKAQPSAPESAAERREKALHAEILKLRQTARTREQTEGMRFAPPPTMQAPVEAAPKKAAGVSVRVSEDGSSVYVDPAELDRLIEERSARMLDERMKPTPEQVQHAMEQRTIESFVREDPERHAPVMQEAARAYHFLQLSLRNAIQTTGAVAYTAEDLISLARETGLAQQFEEFFPEIAPHFDEFVEADVAKNPAWKARVLRRIAAGSAPGEDAAQVRAVPALRSVTSAPRSLAAKGGQRSPSPTPDQAEFETLERAFRKDVVFFPPEKRRRLEELGTKLGKEGYV